MEQRRLRLGDTLDDYCPRERRVTNHAVVAMVEEDVKQTRCTTCDAEHVYKGGRAPRRRKTAAPGALYREVLAGIPEGEYAVAAAGVPVAVMTMSEDHEDTMLASELESDGRKERTGPGVDEAHEAPPGAESPEGPERNDIAEPVEEGPVHRPLIRATLPRPEGQKEIRQVTDFTVRHNNGPRGNGPFRGDRTQPRGPGAGNGGRPNIRRSSGPNPGMPGRGPSPGRGGGAGFRGPNGPQRQGPKKRSR